MRRLKLAFVLPSLHGGGAERAAVTILNSLADDAYDRTMYLFAREGAYLGEVDRAVRLVAPSRVTGRTGRFRALRRFLAEEQFDTVVSFLSHFTVYAAVRASGSAAKYVISQQTPLSAFLGDADYHWRRPMDRRLFTAVARTVYPRADLVAATSRGVGEDLVERYGVRRERIQILHNPVDVDAVRQRAVEPVDASLTTDSRPTIVTAGRLAAAKNLPLLVASLKCLADRLDFRAWILGQGELEGDLRRLLAEAGLEQRVRLLGFQSNPWKFMAAADVFVLTSHYEGFGNVLIEAMASGAPVVATASFGTTEIVQHGKTGLLVDNHEAGAVAAALESVLTNTALRERLATGARVASHEFSVGLVAARCDQILRGLCGWDGCQG